MSKRYNFIQPTNLQNDLTYKPSKNISNFHQVCLFKNPQTHKYHIRRFVFDEYGKCLNVSEYNLTQTQFDKFKKKYKSHEYKCYATYNLDNVKPPQHGELLLAESSLLDNSQISFDGYLQL
jgi:hypothetical protein